MVDKRQQVSINPEELQKLEEIENKRPDVKGYTISKKVHVALQEWFKENLKSSEEIHKTMPLRSNGMFDISNFSLAQT